MSDEEKAPPASLGRVYDAIQAVALDVAVIKTSIPDIADHERRLRALERNENRIIGALIFVTAGFSIIQVIFNR